MTCTNFSTCCQLTWEVCSSTIPSDSNSLRYVHAEQPLVVFPHPAPASIAHTLPSWPTQMSRPSRCLLPVPLTSAPPPLHCWPALYHAVVLPLSPVTRPPQQPHSHCLYCCCIADAGCVGPGQAARGKVPRATG
jgi:hypothetical protein